VKFLRSYRRSALFNVLISAVIVILFFLNRDLFTAASLLYFVALFFRSLDEYLRMTPIR